MGDWSITDFYLYHISETRIIIGLLVYSLSAKVKVPPQAPPALSQTGSISTADFSYVEISRVACPSRKIVRNYYKPTEWEHTSI